MSFKREGDDRSWLNVLNKRRISELFAEDIPEDEALLTKNGRLACLVCHHRPVFDTVNMLALHRSGKKHLAYAEEFLLKKSELDALRLRRQHDHYVNTGQLQTDAQMSTCKSKSSAHPLLGACVYDSRCKRRKTDRRPTVDLTTAAPSPDPQSSEMLSVPFSTGLSESSEKLPQTIADIRKFQKAQVAKEHPPMIKPYIGKRTATAVVSQDCGHSLNVSRPSTERCSGMASVRTRTGEVARGVSSGLDTRSSRRASCSSCLGSSGADKSGGNVGDGKLPGTSLMDSGCLQSERIAGYLKAIGSGWKRSRDGAWIKDGMAEFDSDDEPPAAV